MNVADAMGEKATSDSWWGVHRVMRSWGSCLGVMWPYHHTALFPPSEISLRKEQRHARRLCTKSSFSRFSRPVLNTKNLFGLPGLLRYNNDDVISFPVGLVVKRLLQASSSLCCLRHAPFCFVGQKSYCGPCTAENEIGQL